MEISYGEPSLRHRETLEEVDKSQSVVKDEVEYIVVLEDPDTIERSFVSIWRERKEGGDEEKGFEREHAASGDPGMIDDWFEDFSEGNFPHHMRD